LLSLGYVFEAVDPNTGERVAIKRTSKSGEFVSREFEVLDRLRDCDHVVQMLNIFYSKNNDGKIV
jgi:serine/threonine protein kinase